MRDTYSTEEFLGHSDRCDQEAEGILDLDWDEHVDVPVRVRLLDRWLHEDSPGAAAILTGLRTHQQDAGRADEERAVCGH